MKGPGPTTRIFSPPFLISLAPCPTTRHPMATRARQPAFSHYTATVRYSPNLTRNRIPLARRNGPDGTQPHRRVTEASSSRLAQHVTTHTHAKLVVSAHLFNLGNGKRTFRQKSKPTTNLLNECSHVKFSPPQLQGPPPRRSSEHSTKPGHPRLVGVFSLFPTQHSTTPGARAW